VGDTTSTDNRALVLIRYPNLSGALVIVTATEHGSHSTMRWSCSGCLDGNTGHAARSLGEAANAHSAVCRALPRTPETTA